MSGYAAGEALLLTQLQKHASFTTQNSNRGNWKALNSGKSSYYVILRPGAFEIEMQSIGGVGANATATEHTMWVTQCMVYERYKDESTSIANLEARVEDVIEQLQAWRNLGDTGDTILKARVASGGEVEQVADDKGGMWLRWIINVEWQEERTVTYSE